MTAISRLPVVIRNQIPSVPFPLNYEIAKKALRECVDLDEAKDIKDKSAAIATYAKQAKDKSLLHLAERIRLRAYERMGELLTEIQPANRRDVALQHGIGSHYRGLIDIARIPSPKRDQLIDSTPPPRKMDLVRMGRLLDPQYKPQKPYSRSPEEILDEARRDREYQRDDALPGALDRILGMTAVEHLQLLDSEDEPVIRERIIRAIEVLDEIEQIISRNGK